MNKRLYTEKDIGRLIQRATELQQKNESSERGLSLDEIKQLAADLGVDPVYMEQAALDLEHTNEKGSPFSITGAPYSVQSTLVVEGALDDRLWEEIVLEVRKVVGTRGNVSDLGKIREWVYDLDGLFSTRVSVKPREEQTVIDIHKDHRGLAFTAYFVSLFIGVTFAGIALDGSGLSDTLTFILAGSGGVGGLISVRAALSVWKNQQVKQVKRLASRITSLFGERESVGTSESFVQELMPVSTLPVEEEVDDVQSAGEGKRRQQIRT